MSRKERKKKKKTVQKGFGQFLNSSIEGLGFSWAADFWNQMWYHKCWYNKGFYLFFLCLSSCPVHLLLSTRLGCMASWSVLAWLSLEFYFRRPFPSPAPASYPVGCSMVEQRHGCAASRSFSWNCLGWRGRGRKREGRLQHENQCHSFWSP